MALRIQLLGPFQVWRGQEFVQWTKGEKHKALLKILLTEPGKVFSHDELIEYLWPEDEPEKAKANLFNRVAELRRILEPNLKRGSNSKYILTCHLGFSFNPEDCWIDAYEFQQHYRKFRQLDNGGDSSHAIQEAEAACNLYQGDFLEEDRYEDWAQAAREHFKNQYIEMSAFLAEHYARCGEYQRAISVCLGMLERDQLRESVYRQLMLYQYICGDQSEALRTFERCQAVLEANLDVEPDRETKRLYEQIKAGNVPDIDRCYPEPTRPTPEVPYTLSRLPFIGRQPELACLAGYLEQARQGRGCLLLISGEAGWGKTRLAHELIAYARRFFQSHSLQGRCSDISYVAYQPWAEILREGVQYTSFLSDIPALWLAEVAQLVPEVRLYKPDLPTNPELPAQQARLRFFEGLSQFLLSLAEHKNLSKPLVLFLDDLHWIDAASLDFLSYFLPHIEQHPILFIGAYRSEEVSESHLLQKFIQTWEPKGLVRLLTIPPWTIQEVHILLQSLPLRIENLQVLTQRLYQESEGVPLFVILTLQHLFEIRLLQIEGEAWVAADEGYVVDAKKLPLPRSIRELIKRRLSWLSKPELELLQVASVIGREFEYAVLQQAWEGDSLTALERLGKAHLVIERHGRYEFSHDKIREVVYEGLSLLRRQLLHGRVLQAFEQVYTGRLETAAEVLARHAYRAGEHKKALEYSIRGLKRTVREYRHQDGLELAEIGLEAVKRLQEAGEDQRYVDEQRFEILSQHVEIFHLQGRRREQEYSINSMKEIAHKQNDPAKMALALQKRSLMNLALGKHAAAEQDALESLKTYKDIKDYRRQAISLTIVGLVRHNLGDQVTALSYHEKALAIRQEIEDRQGQAASLNNIANAYQHLGRSDEALRCHQRALAIAQEIGDRRSQAHSLHNMGVVYQDLGEYELALQYTQQALEIRHQIGDKQGQAASLNNIANTLYSMDKYEEALSLHQQVSYIMQQIGDHLGLGSNMHNLGNVCYGLGRFEEALQYYTQALQIRGKTGDRPGQSATLSNIGSALYRLGQYKEALGYHQQALEIRKQIKDPQGEATSLHNIGGVYYGLEQYEEALRYIQQALKIRQEIGDRRGQASSLSNIAKSYSKLQRHTEALQYYEKACAMYEELKLQGFRLLCLSAQAISHLELNEKEQALRCSAQAIHILEDGQSCENPQEAYFNHYKVLSSCGCYSEALKYLQKAYEEVIRRAERVKNPEWRESFLKNVITNREIIAAWKQHSSPTPRLP